MSTSIRSLVAGVLMAGTASTAVEAAPVCLETYRIQDTKIPDSHTILFRMNDGTLWRNSLKNACPTLRFYGFVWVDNSGLGEICENQEAVRVIHSGEICILGNFTKEAPHVPA